MLATSDAVRSFFVSLARARKGDWKKARLSSVLLLRAFARGFQRGNFCSSVSICFANKRVQLRRRLSAIDAFACKGRCFPKIVREPTHMKSSSGIYYDKITRGSCLFGRFRFQNCTDQFCVCARVRCAKSVEALPFQSKIPRRNRERFHGVILQAGSDESFVGDRYFIEAVGPMHHPCFLYAEKR